MTLTMTSALEEGKTKKTSGLEMLEPRVLEISPSLEVERKTKQKKLGGKERDSPFLLEVDLTRRRSFTTSKVIEKSLFKNWIYFDNW